ncbi:FAD-dependent oxidoreductase [Paenibacillus apiarius]|uniref:FAD-dependent oxidoreductase n=1 Tax=Paenibacillus apiarius TaxID=46240 RepID=A0ABT4DWY0_9BACL|nr:FAD-dependent oxidoreductase [Paenibacillus apiarius]MCY9515411.1 FAD-dependent oxidoreductase [Paenibacillus apiarius]MCY9521867.1 FAD-dependent oxidoreductase [Paenibacillus apiarius]MCY9550260.1 FAD-dependent oxidoreductase [Paenibacillus apiarius]MCY9559536.1 FAD-dependent oxidoreductase [Paenibacillus apiarius]MCY9686846.1 FAD-dependent oxidoreductase [Paenibacillus apiarius]
MNRMKADAVVIGGGLGGTLAAWVLAKRGYQVVLTEETDWVGGQLTSQAVPPDEHPWIEQTGCTDSYREFRQQVRHYYRRRVRPDLVCDEARFYEHFNPGNAWVSRISHEPAAAHGILQQWLRPFVEEGRLHILYDTIPVRAQTEGDQVQEVTVRHLKSGEETALAGDYFVDATEYGDLLPLAGVEYNVGADSRHDTGEPHAPDEANPEDTQAFTVVIAVEMLPEHAAHLTAPIPQPEMYEFWRSFYHEGSPYPLLSWWDTKPNANDEYRCFTFLPGSSELPMWTYRRVVDAAQFRIGEAEGDISLINWPQNDYSLASIIEMPYEERQQHVERAKQLSLSLLYWLQTEAPREDGGTGYPGLRLCGKAVGTEDGLAKSPYIRESRRIQAIYTITEADVNKELRQGKGEGIRRYEDSVGVGHYFLDLHMTAKSRRSMFIPAYRYEIPLGALIPKRVQNVLPACKNIGTTQIANGCYRLHPTEWNIGESIGHLVAYALDNGVTPHEVHGHMPHLKAYQKELDEAGIQRSWPFDGTDVQH